jgi:predicted dehydrogenase
MMQIGVIGCGYVFDHYMSTLAQHPVIEIRGITDIDRSRVEHVGRYYALKVYGSNEALLADPEIKIALNLTSIDHHYEVTKACLLAGKHVYSEKPFTTDLDQMRELMALAEVRGLRLSGAPCNAMSDMVQTMWRAIRDGAVGRVRVVYAECDDNPIYLMRPEIWRSRTGAPWPYIHEYEAGCTFEHAGYYLSWLAAMFGPVRSLTAFSKCLVPDKTNVALHPSDTPDFSVACLEFDSGVTARLTISIVAPFDHRLRVIGDEGELTVNTYRDDHCPVRLERFSGLTLNARKARWVRENSLLQGLLGVGGSMLPLLHRTLAPTVFRRWINPLQMIKKMQLGAQDKFLGVAEMACAITESRAPWLTPEFILHVTELTLAMQRAGVSGQTHQLETSFVPLAPLAFANSAQGVHLSKNAGLLARLVDPLLDRLHKH